MQMSYDHLDPTVDMLVDYINENPTKVTFETNTITIKWIEYWDNGREVTETWNGYSCKKVFNAAQGKRIREAVNKAKIYQQTKEQESIIRKMNKKALAQEKPKKSFIQILKSLFTRK